MVCQDLGKPVCTSGVHQVSQELNILGAELLLVLHVNIYEITLPDLWGLSVVIYELSGVSGYVTCLVMGYSLEL